MVKKRYPSQELLAAGWSLGGNILVRYLGEEGDRSPISAAASLCNPLDLVSPSVHADASLTHSCSLAHQVVIPWPGNRARHAYIAVKSCRV